MSMQAATDHGTGDILFSPGKEHWHGNKPDAESPFSHLSRIAQPERAEPTAFD
jgi:hypothetical protein